MAAKVEKGACAQCGTTMPLDQLKQLVTGELTLNLCADCYASKSAALDAEGAKSNKETGHMVAAQEPVMAQKQSLSGGAPLAPEKSSPGVQGAAGDPDLKGEGGKQESCGDCGLTFLEDNLTSYTPPKGKAMMLCPDCVAARAAGDVKAKKDHADPVPVTRRDYCDLPSADYMTTNFKRTPEGYLKGRAIITNVGVFTYKDAQGTHAELRLPEEVFDTDSLESLKLKPLTNDHPDVKKTGGVVTVENIKELQVGNLGDNPSSTSQQRGYDSYTPADKLTDGYHVAIDLIVQDPAAIQDVLNGKDALSCGYTCDLDQAEPGAKWCGMPYDFIQRRIRYNHVAIVDKARAGDMAKIKLDSADDAVQIKPTQEEIMKKITLDGVEYEAEAPVLAELSKTKQRADTAEASVATLTKDKSTLEAERDTLKDRCDGLTKDLEKAKADSIDPAKLEAAIQAKLQLRLTAARAGVEVKADVADADLMKAVILKVSPSAKLDGKDAVYIQARFDSVVEQLGDKVSNDAATVALMGAVGLPVGEHADQEDGEGLGEADKARERYLRRLRKGTLNTDADDGADDKEED